MVGEVIADATTAVAGEAVTAAAGEVVMAATACDAIGDIELEEVQIGLMTLDLHLKTSDRGPAALDLCPTMRARGRWRNPICAHAPRAVERRAPGQSMRGGDGTERTWPERRRQRGAGEGLSDRAEEGGRESGAGASRERARATKETQREKGAECRARVGHTLV
jgi:hypothetical protein